MSLLDDGVADTLVLSGAKVAPREILWARPSF